MSATIEFALVAPAVAVMIGVAVAAVGAAGESMRLADAAGAAARAAGRGDDPGALAQRLAPGSRVEVTGDDPVCVRLGRTVALGWLTSGLDLSARSCAPGGGL